MTIKQYRGVSYVDNKETNDILPRALTYRGVDYLSTDIQKRAKAKSGIYRGFNWSL